MPRGRNLYCYAAVLRAFRDLLPTDVLISETAGGERE